MTGPAGKRLVEVDIEHHAAEIEQQRVGGAGGEQGLVHRGGYEIGEADVPVVNTDTARCPAAGTR